MIQATAGFRELPALEGYNGNVSRRNRLIDEAANPAGAPEAQYGSAPQMRNVTAPVMQSGRIFERWQCDVLVQEIAS